VIKLVFVNYLVLNNRFYVIPQIFIFKIEPLLPDTGIIYDSFKIRKRFTVIQRINQLDFNFWVIQTICKFSIISKDSFDSKGSMVIYFPIGYISVRIYFPGLHLHFLHHQIFRKVTVVEIHPFRVYRDSNSRPTPHRYFRQFGLLLQCIFEAIVFLLQEYKFLLPEIQVSFKNFFVILTVLIIPSISSKSCCAFILHNVWD